MNERGDVVGGTTDADGVTHAMVWDRHGRPHELPGTPGAVGAVARDITDSRVVMGQVSTADFRHIAVVWRPRSR